MTDDVKVEIRITHPTEGTVSKEYTLDDFPDEFMPQGLTAAELPPWVQAIICAKKCTPKAGFLACVARCMVTGEACDNGIDNCS